MDSQDFQSKYADKLIGKILDRLSLTENLADAEAKILLDWGTQQAERVAALAQDDEDVDEKGGDLMKLMKSINRLVGYRGQKDNIWFIEKLTQLDKYSQSIQGPMLTEEQRASLQNHTEKSDTELLQALLAIYTPLSKDTPSDIEAFQPDTTEIDTYTPPTSDIDTYEAPYSGIEVYKSPASDIIESETPDADAEPPQKPNLPKNIF